MVKKSEKEIIADGVNDTYTIPMGYISTAHLTFTVDSVAATPTFPTSTQFTLPSVPTLSQVIKISRNTPTSESEINELINFIGGASLPRVELNKLRDLFTYIIEEREDSGADSASIPSPTGQTNRTLISDGTDIVFADRDTLVDSAKLTRAVRNETGSTITKGAALYITGYSLVHNMPTVGLADANDSAKMPAVGLAEADITNNSNDKMVSAGTLAGIDTSGYSIQDTLYVSTTAGQLTNAAPSGGSDEVQPIATVERSDASDGQILVKNMGESFVVPASETPTGVDINVYNSSGGSLTAGTTVYLTGYHSGTGFPTVASAKSDDAARMPAIGLVVETIVNSSSGKIRIAGKFAGTATYNLNTSSMSIGQQLYPNSSGTGGLSNVRPAGATSKVQPFAFVTRVHASLGEILILGSGGSNNDLLPNLSNNTVWVGNGSNVPTETAVSTLGGVFTEVYTSAGIDTTSNSNGVLTHSLTGKPKLCYAFLECLTAEYGYDIGDEAPVNPKDQMSFSASSTEIKYAFLANIRTNFRNVDTNATVTLTAANWELKYRAFY